MLIHSPKELAVFIIRQRKKLKSQAKVGQLTGLKQQTISEFEKRPENIQVNTLFRIISALNLDMDLFGKNETAAKSTWKEEW